MEDIKESDIDWEKANKAKANPEAMEKMLLDAGWVSLGCLRWRYPQSTMSTDGVSIEDAITIQNIFDQWGKKL